ncbi:MAG: hypothetical protein QNI96_12615 [Woeseiaceae bacterium]|nr:hypothetical protein [Woeseiaceae bacterium]
MRKLIGLICLLGLLSGCASTKIPPMENLQREVSSYPKPGSVLIRPVGDQIASQKVRTVTPALQITAQVVFGKTEDEKSIATCGIAVPAGTWAFSGIYDKEDYNADCFGPIQMNAAYADGSTNWNCGKKFERHVCREKGDEFFVVTSLGRWHLKQDSSAISVISIVAKGQEQLFRDLTYNGPKGNSATFTYRESRGDPPSLVFEDDIQYEIDGVTVLNVHGFHLAVSAATDTDITYELLGISDEGSTAIE